LGAEKARGGVLIYSDPHCDYPVGSLAHLAQRAEDTGAIVQPCNVSDLHGKSRTRYGGELYTCNRGLRVKRTYGEPHQWPALMGTIYAMQRDVYDYLGGWPPLPGCWGYGEQTMTLTAWNAGVPIIVDDKFSCVHQNYHP